MWCHLCGHHWKDILFTHDDVDRRRSHDRHLDITENLTDFWNPQRVLHYQTMMKLVS